MKRNNTIKLAMLALPLSLILILAGTTLAFFNYVKTGTGLSSISLPTSLVRIEAGAFADMENLTSVTMANNVTHIDPYAFSSDQSLTTISLSNSLTEIGDYAFAYSRNIQNLVLPNSLRKVGEEALSDVDFGNSYTIPTGITQMGPSAFDSSHEGRIKISSSDIDNWIIGGETYAHIKQEDADITPDNVYYYYGGHEWVKSN